MAVALLIRVPGMTTRDYEAVMDEMGLPLHMDSPNWPRGVVSHVAGQTDEGLCVVDVWDSRQDFDRFMEERLGPAMQKLGGTSRPDITQVEVYNMYRHGR